MTAAIVPVSQALVTLPVRAVAGERMMMDGGTAPLRDILQNLYDRSQHGLDALAAQLVWSGSFGVDAGGTLTVFAVNIPTITSITLIDATGNAYVHAGGGSAITVTKVESAPGTLGAVAQWWYVYAWRNAGVLDYEISTTAPSAGLIFKNADVTRRYLGCFCTTAAGAPIAVRAHRGKYTYLQAVPGAASIADAASVGYEALSLATRAPPHSRVAIANIVLTGAAAFRAVGDAGGFGATVTNQPIVLDATQNIEWTDGGAGTITVDVRGFEE